MTESKDPIYIKVKPYYKSVTIILGILSAVVPALLEFWQAGKFDAASIVSMALGVGVIINRILSTPAILEPPAIFYRYFGIEKK